MPILLVITILTCYLIASVWLWRNALDNKSTAEQPPLLKQSKLPYLLIFVGLASHLYLAASLSYVDHSFNFSVASMSIWIGALLVILFLIGNCFLPIKNLALLTVPLSALSVLFSAIWGDQQLLIDQQSSLFYWHIAFSISGFTVLTLCVLQSLLFAAQEYGLRNKKWLMWVQLLPALQVMERLLFGIIWLGFILISIAIVLGFIVNNQAGNGLISFNHHTMLSLLGWLAFGILLCGRHFRGWRGSQTVKWTLIGFTLIELGYFGTKLVQETLT